MSEETAAPAAPAVDPQVTEADEHTPVVPVPTTSLPQVGSVRELQRRLLGGDRTLKRREVASGVGVSLHSARKIWRALGFPNWGDQDVAFTESDQQALETIVGLVREGLLTEETAISIARSIGQMTDRMVVWQVEALVEDLMANQGIPDAEARQNIVEVLPALIDPLEQVLRYSWRRQLNAAVQPVVPVASIAPAASNAALVNGIVIAGAAFIAVQGIREVIEDDDAPLSAR